MIHLSRVFKEYQQGEEHFFALRDITVTVQRGEFVSILGPSGSGKSTLLHLFGGLDRPTSGGIEVAGTNIALCSDRELAIFRNATVGFVFQSFNLLPYLSALENVMLPLLYSQTRWKRRMRAQRLLELVGLGSKLRNKPAELSGGEQQRVAIARALANNPDIILADEPTGNLDTKTGSLIVEILSVLHRSGKTIVVVTHDHHLASHGQRVIQLSDGQVIAK